MACTVHPVFWSCLFLLAKHARMRTHKHTHTHARTHAHKNVQVIYMPCTVRPRSCPIYFYWQKLIQKFVILYGPAVHCETDVVMHVLYCALTLKLSNTG